MDITVLAVVAALILIAHLSDPALTHVFPIFNTDGSLVYPEYAYPRRKQIVPTWASALLATLVPILFIGIAQVRRKSIDDFLTTTMGVLKSVVTASFLQVVIKVLIGGLRPHFYTACQPDLARARAALSNSPTAPFGGAPTIIPMFDISICTGNPEHIKDAVKSMPSGHTATSWSGLFFLALYFNAQLKVVGAHNPAYWKMMVFFAPILGATLLSLYLITDAHHHTEDLVIGAAIGILSALVAFRQTFASITDFRFNHVLLPRSTSLFYRHPEKHEVPRPWYEYEPRMRVDWESEAPVGREGGWGLRGAAGGIESPDGEWESCAVGIGAPGDAADVRSLRLPRSRWESEKGHVRPSRGNFL